MATKKHQKTQNPKSEIRRRLARISDISLAGRAQTLSPPFRVFLCFFVAILFYSANIVSRLSTRYTHERFHRTRQPSSSSAGGRRRRRGRADAPGHRQRPRRGGETGAERTDQAVDRLLVLQQRRRE